MDMTRFKVQHQEILNGIDTLRQLSRTGVQTNAQAIADNIASLSDVIIRHLAVEDRILYPAVQASDNPELAQMGRTYQKEMTGIANGYIAFSRHWSQAHHVRDDPDGFKEDANTILKAVYLRMQKENREFYPAVESM